MKFREDRPFASIDPAVKKLLEIANGLEPDHAGRIHVGAINALFMTAGGDAPEYSACLRPAGGAGEAQPIRTDPWRRARSGFPPIDRAR
jgi:hypothetical protein